MVKLAKLLFPLVLTPPCQGTTIRTRADQRPISSDSSFRRQLLSTDSLPSPADSIVGPFHYLGTKKGKAVKPGTELRILCVGDSITVGFLSDQDGGDGNGYRLKLRKDLSHDQVYYAGTETSGSMYDGYYAAWSGTTIKYISDHIQASLEQRPNIILVHAGTNDMNPNPSISTEGNSPEGAVKRLGDLVDLALENCPDAVILVAQIINTCDPTQEPATQQFQALMPGLAADRQNQGKHVIAVDFTTFSTKMLRDCIHPTNAGYRLFGDYWYDFVTQVPKDWIQPPIGKDIVRPGGSSSANGQGERLISALGMIGCITSIAMAVIR